MNRLTLLKIAIRRWNERQKAAKLELRKIAVANYLCWSHLQEGEKNRRGEFLPENAIVYHKKLLKEYLLNFYYQILDTFSFHHSSLAYKNDQYQCQTPTFNLFSHSNRIIKREQRKTGKHEHMEEIWKLLISYYHSFVDATVLLPTSAPVLWWSRKDKRVNKKTATKRYKTIEDEREREGGKFISAREFLLFSICTLFYIPSEFPHYSTLSLVRSLISISI
jgi:hypothetical protein